MVLRISSLPQLLRLPHSGSTARRNTTALFLGRERRDPRGERRLITSFMMQRQALRLGALHPRNQRIFWRTSALSSKVHGILALPRGDQS